MLFVVSRHLSSVFISFGDIVVSTMTMDTALFFKTKAYTDFAFFFKYVCIFFLMLQFIVALLAVRTYLKYLNSSFTNLKEVDIFVLYMQMCLCKCV